MWMTLSKIIKKYRGEALLFCFIAMSWAIGTLVYAEFKILEDFPLYFSMAE
jgi:hypothetical protein